MIGFKRVLILSAVLFGALGLSGCIGVHKSAQVTLDQQSIETTRTDGPAPIGEESEIFSSSDQGGQSGGSNLTNSVAGERAFMGFLSPGRSNPISILDPDALGAEYRWAGRCPRGVTPKELIAQEMGAFRNNMLAVCDMPGSPEANLIETAEGTRIVEFGGIIGSGLDPVTRQSVSYPNPLTGSSSCPTGFVRTNAYGSYSQDFNIDFCWRLIQSAGERAFPEWRYGGMTSSTQSCPAGFQAHKIHGTLAEIVPGQSAQFDPNRYVCLMRDGGPVADVVPPSVPSGIRLVSKTAQSICLEWDESTDPVPGTGVAGYRVRESGTTVRLTAEPSVCVTGLSPNTEYSFRVRAYDAADPANESADSPQFLARTSDATGSGELEGLPEQYHNSTDRVKIGQRDDAGWTRLNPLADQIVFVSAAGDDTRDGRTMATAVRTLAKGFSLASSRGSSLLFRRGDVFQHTGSLDTANFSGASASAPRFIGYYGNNALARPKLVLSSSLKFTKKGTKNLAIIGLHLEQMAGEKSDGLSVIAESAANILIEDCLIKGFKDNLNLQGYTVSGQSPYVQTGWGKNYQLRYNVVLDSSNSGSVPHASRNSGIFSSKVNGLLLEGNVFDRNGTHTSLGGQGSIYSHNVYIQKSVDNLHAYYNISTRAGSHGAQFRTGGNIQANLFVKNSMGFLVGHDDSTSNFPVPQEGGKVQYNLIVDAKDINTQSYSFQCGEYSDGRPKYCETGVQRRNAGMEYKQLTDYTISDNMILWMESGTGSQFSGIDMVAEHLGNPGTNLMRNLVFQWRKEGPNGALASAKCDSSAACPSPSSRITNNVFHGAPVGFAGTGNTILPAGAQGPAYRIREWAEENLGQRSDDAFFERIRGQARHRGVPNITAQEVIERFRQRYSDLLPR